MKTHYKVWYTLIVLTLVPMIVCAVLCSQEPTPEKVTATVSAIHGQPPGVIRDLEVQTHPELAEIDVDVSFEDYETTRLTINNLSELPKLGDPIPVYIYKEKVQATNQQDAYYNGLMGGAIGSGSLLFVILFIGGMTQPKRAEDE